MYENDINSAYFILICKPLVFTVLLQYVRHLNPCDAIGEERAMSEPRYQCYCHDMRA